MPALFSEDHPVISVAANTELQFYFVLFALIFLWSSGGIQVVLAPRPRFASVPTGHASSGAAPQHCSVATRGIACV